jgi:hypothetical protein
MSLVEDTVMLPTGWNAVGNAKLVSKMSLVEDIVFLLPGEAGGNCKARIGEGLVSCQRYCDATTGWKPVGNARVLSVKDVSVSKMQ